MDGMGDVPGKTLADQAYGFLRERILNGIYRSGQKLPSLRETAETLCISRNTAERAYEQLLAEGYVECRRKSGYYVEDFDADAIAHAAKRPAAWGDEEPETLGHPYESDASIVYDFCYTNPAPDAFPFDTWRKLTSALLYSSEAQLNNQYCNPMGDVGLRGEIARYVFDSRGVACAPEQVIVQTGLADSLDRLLKLFSPHDDVVAFEDPCLSVAQTVFASNRFAMRALDVSTPRRFRDDLVRSNAKLVYVTPSHQFPTGSTMALADRIALLDWATSSGAYIIEDDYDSEFRYKTKSIPSLHALDSNDRVVYAGSFSKTLSPSLRIGYVILPPDLAYEYKRRFQILPCSAPWLNQRVLYHFFSQGHWGRHLRKYVTMNRKKRAALLDACETVFGGRLELSGVDAGLHVWARLEGNEDAETLIAAARAAGVAVYSARSFYYDDAHRDPAAFILGHSKIAEEDILPGIRRLRDAWDR